MNTDQNPNYAAEQQARQDAYARLTETAKDIFYYIVVLNGGEFSFRDLWGHTDTMNAILNIIPRDEMFPHGAGGFFHHASEFTAMFAEEISTGAYTVPKFGRK